MAASGSGFVSGSVSASGPQNRGPLVHPSFLQTLTYEQEWIFGAIADLFDNARDAEAKAIFISLEQRYSEIGKTIDMLCIRDDGVGMTHQELLKMMSFEQIEHGSVDRIGRSGCRFKRGAMRLGKDALVLTQTPDTQSIAYLSHTLNEGKNVIQVPTCSFMRDACYYDISMQSESLSKSHMDAITNFSPFSQSDLAYFFSMFEESTGTVIYIWNLDMCDDNYTLQLRRRDGESDICTSHQRVRTRAGQESRDVPLDWSLRAYLEVLYYNPNFTMYVQGSQVEPKLVTSLIKDVSYRRDWIMGANVELYLGYSNLEASRNNCGIFIYWRGRLIEAYKRVGVMLYNSQKSHGLIGFIDVTTLMDNGSDQALVHANKQCFLESWHYSELVHWLSKQVNLYIDANADTIPMASQFNVSYDGHVWAQCDFCGKWRILPHGVSRYSLGPTWFCYMPPFSGNCMIPQEGVGDEEAMMVTRQLELFRLAD